MATVIFPEWIRHPWWIVAYLIDPESIRHLPKEIELVPDKKFDKTIEEYTQAFIVDGKMPPDAIAPAILNIADDLRHGRQPTIRLGDYIAIQKFARGKG